jgi:hypothetical protein
MAMMMPMAHDPGKACEDCGMPGDLCTCDAMDQCEGDYCGDMAEVPVSAPEPKPSLLRLKK